MMEYDSLIANTRYCNDTTGTWQETGENLIFGAYDRLKENTTPTYICPNTDKTYGGEYDLKVGLLSADEAAYAGAIFNKQNKDYYLHINKDFILGTAYNSNSASSNVFRITHSGSLRPVKSFSQEDSVLPVINLRSDILYTSGNGTIDEPFVVDINSVK